VNGKLIPSMERRAAGIIMKIDFVTASKYNMPVIELLLQLDILQRRIGLVDDALADEIVKLQE